MKNKTRGTLSIVVMLALVFSLATTAFASSHSDKGNSSGHDVRAKAQVASAKANAVKAGMPELRKSVRVKAGGALGMAGGAVENAIAALSEEDKEALSDVIEAYEEAAAAAAQAMEDAQKGDDLSEYRKTVMTALKDLLDTAKEAGIDLKAPMSSAASMNGQLHRSWNGNDFTDTLEEALAALSEEDKETLGDYIEAYEEALAKAQEAKENADEGEDLSSSHEAVLAALKDLLDAAKEADIDLGLKGLAGSEDGGFGIRIGQRSAEFIEAAIAELSDEDKEALIDVIGAYEDAVAAAQEALENAGEDDDLSAYREAVVAALKDLIDAAAQAEIDLGLLKTPHK